MTADQQVPTIKVGARRSPLAVAQARWVADQLAAAGHPSELVGIDTLGDKDRRRLTEIGGTGVFATAVRDGLLAGEIDVAVHSLKDLPVDPAPGLVVAAIPEREDVRDVLVGLAPEKWVDGSRIGTGSPRRAVQVEALAAARGVTVEVVPVRGNVAHRFGLVTSAEVDATLLAAAGLRRLGLLVGEAEQIDGVPITIMPLDVLLPAAGQGALAVECRSDADPALLAALSDIDHAPTRAAVEAERSFLKTLEAGCLAPVGAIARDGQLGLTLSTVTGRTGTEASDALVRAERSGRMDDALSLGQELAREVLGQLGGNQDD